MNLQQQVYELINSQLSDWELAAKNYAGLKSVQTRCLSMGQHEVLVQFNPERIRSSAAKVDVKSIQERACFLCNNHLPTQQKGIPFGNEYLILVNPFPIFPCHLTIPHLQHVPQLIEGKMNDMLCLAKELDGFTIFYNGPKCGASAPDHFHFQAGNKGFLPIEHHFVDKQLCHAIQEADGVTTYGWKHYHRGLLSLQGDDIIAVEKSFNQVFDALKRLQPNEAEPMLNVLASYDSGMFTIHVFPRILHRPAQFFAEGDAQILLSPASVDLGGVFITPREEDYKKITSTDIESILHQVSMPQVDVEELVYKK